MRYAFASFHNMRHTRWTNCRAHLGTGFLGNAPLAAHDTRCPHWEMYVDLYDERQAQAPVSAANMPAELQASESFSRLVAYASPYLFWSMVTFLGVGLVALQ